MDHMQVRVASMDRIKYRVNIYDTEDDDIDEDDIDDDKTTTNTTSQ